MEAAAGENLNCYSNLTSAQDMRKKLLVLDLNGLLIYTWNHGKKKFEAKPRIKHSAKVSRSYVYKRPFSQEFLEFCLENFSVGIWSSSKRCVSTEFIDVQSPAFILLRYRENVGRYVDFVFGDLKGKLLFVWDQGDCTNTGVRHFQNWYKPMFLKELRKLWNKDKLDLPWNRGDYAECNTLLIDDSPYKTSGNPMFSSISPWPYTASDEQDNYLVCVMKVYLEGVRDAESVQQYVMSNPLPSSVTVDPGWIYLKQLYSPGCIYLREFLLSHVTSHQDRCKQGTSLVLYKGSAGAKLLLNEDKEIAEASLIVYEGSADGTFSQNTQDAILSQCTQVATID